MPSFDIANKIDHQTLDNVINVVRKEIATRYELRDSKSTIDLDKKTLKIHLLSESDMRIGLIEDMIRSRMIKQRLDPLALDFGKEQYAAGQMVKKDITIKEGIDKDNARKIIKHIKDLKLKVEAQMMDDQIRVTGKKIDELQQVISALKAAEFEVPLQYINLK